MDGSDSEGDANGILEEKLGEDYFPPNFKDYMLKERLKWSRFKSVYSSGWVFWSQQDPEIEPSLSLDNWANFNPNVRGIPNVEYNIRHALEKMMSLYSSTMVGSYLVQFWAPAKTLEGQTRLTIQYQPFALGPTWSTIERQQLCEYRMQMCSSEYNNCFYADAGSGEERLGLPGRVFLHQFPESTPNVNYYSTKEYPQSNLALCCKIRGSWAVPVFDHSNRTCVGVLEMVSQSNLGNYYDWRTRHFHRKMQKILECNFWPGEASRAQQNERVIIKLSSGWTLKCQNRTCPVFLTTGNELYEMRMCREYNFFYADAESGEEQLGIPGRVFLHQFPESTPRVEFYSTKEYPQRDLALSCEIQGSWAVPVFEHSSHTCVGVLEIVSPYLLRSIWHKDSFLLLIYDSFQELGLHAYQACEEKPLLELGLNCFDVYQDCEEEFRVKGIAHAFQELNTALRSVCEIHELPLALTWVPCSACNGLRRCKLGSRAVEFTLGIDLHNATGFLKVSQCYHLRKGLVAGRALSSPNILYCSDITQLSVDEYPLVPYARQCKLSGWFTICLRSLYTGNYIYVLEFFLSTRSKYDEDVLTTLSFILGTIEEKFANFRLASGKQLGELMPFEVIYFQNDQKIHSVQSIQATREFSMSSIPSSMQSSASVANTRLGFQDANMVDANMVTIKTEYDQFFDADPFSDYDPSSHSDSSFEQSIASVANTRPGFQDANMVTIKAKYASIAIVLKLSLSCRLVELQQKVAERLELEAGTYHVVHKDEEDGFVLIACDEDLQAYVDDSISQGNTSPVVLLQPKEPATNLNPIN